MRTEKELLELAAAAIGLKAYFNKANACQLTTDGTEAGYIGFWNPLNDDGKALRLSAELGIGLQYVYRQEWNRVSRGVIARHMEHECEFWGDDMARCARRAIVTVAAAIGETL